MTRRAWTAIAIAVAVNVGVLVGALVTRTDGTARATTRLHPALVGDDGKVVPVRHHRAPRPRPSTTTTTLVPLAAPPGARVALRSLGAPVSRVDTPDRVIFLGIDDGIWRDEEVVQVLTDAKVPFTMFLTRPYAKEGLDYFRRLQAVGGTVESHTLTHPDLTTMSYAQQQREVCGPVADYTLWFGRRPTLFRPPYGRWNALTRQAAASCGLRALVLWQGATNGGELQIPGGVLHPGDILLLHFRHDLAANLRVVFAAARAQGFTIARLEDYLG